jgi:hypothetical protein
MEGEWQWGEESNYLSYDTVCNWDSNISSFNCVTNIDNIDTYTDALNFFLKIINRQASLISGLGK